MRRASALAANEQWTKVDVGGKTAKLRVDYFDTPMKQPKAKKGRVADRTGCRPWPVARPLLAHLCADVIPDLERDLGRPPRVLELGSGVGLLGVGLAMTTDCDVTLTDPDIETNFSDGTSMSTLEWLQRNIELNVRSKRARARRLVWGSVDDARALLRDGGFDLLVGSDLLYDTANYGPARRLDRGARAGARRNFGLRDAPRRRGGLGRPRGGARLRRGIGAARRRGPHEGRDGDDADGALICVCLWSGRRVLRASHLLGWLAGCDEVASPTAAPSRQRGCDFSRLPFALSTPALINKKKQAFHHDARRAAVAARADALAALVFAAE